MPYKEECSHLTKFLYKKCTNDETVKLKLLLIQFISNDFYAIIPVRVSIIWLILKVHL
jgi:hypothetical protein